MTATTAKKTTAPKSAKKPLSRAVAIERAEGVEKRIMRLEAKLAKDRELYKRYTDLVKPASPAPVPEDAVASELV
jgi:hypothetical protein